MILATRSLSRLGRRLLFFFRYEVFYKPKESARPKILERDRENKEEGKRRRAMSARDDQYHRPACIDNEMEKEKKKNPHTHTYIDSIALSNERTLANLISATVRWYRDRSRIL